MLLRVKIGLQISVSHTMKIAWAYWTYSLARNLEKRSCRWRLKMEDWTYQHHTAWGGKCGTKQLWKTNTNIFVISGGGSCYEVGAAGWDRQRGGVIGDAAPSPPARGSGERCNGERCKLPQQGSGRSPDRQRILVEKRGQKKRGLQISFSFCWTALSLNSCQSNNNQLKPVSQSYV